MCYCADSTVCFLDFATLDNRRVHFFLAVDLNLKKLAEQAFCSELNDRLCFRDFLKLWTASVFTFIGLLVSIIGTNFHLLLEAF